MGELTVHLFLILVLWSWRPWWWILLAPAPWWKSLSVGGYAICAHVPTWISWSQWPMHARFSAIASRLGCTLWCSLCSKSLLGGGWSWTPAGTPFWLHCSHSLPLQSTASINYLHEILVSGSASRKPDLKQPPFTGNSLCVLLGQIIKINTQTWGRRVLILPLISVVPTWRKINWRN